MKKLLPLLVLVALCSTFATCKKEDETGDKLYFRVKINGADYVPSNCANCLNAQILRDTTFLFNANVGFESLAMGFHRSTKLIPQTILLDGISGLGTYDDSPQVNHIFKTDITHLGQLQITEINTLKKTVRGNFYFKAFNSVRNSEVNVTEGAFHLNYTTN